MRSWMAGIVLVAVGLVAVGPGHVRAEEPGGAAELSAAVSAFGEAFVAADVATLSTMLTDNYLHINGSSGTVIERDAWLEWLGSRRGELDSGALVIEAYEVSDLDIRIHGDAAVVTGIVRSSGVSNGEKFSTRLRFTNTWVLSDDGWLRAGFHDSRVPE